MPHISRLLAVALMLGLVSLAAQAQPYGDHGFHRPPPHRYYHRAFHRPPPFLRHNDERR